MSMIIEDHSAIGTKGDYAYKNKMVRVTVIAVRRSPSILFNAETMKEVPRATLIELKLQPVDGGRAFWSKAMKYVGKDKRVRKAERKSKADDLVTEGA